LGIGDPAAYLLRLIILIIILFFPKKARNLGRRLFAFLPAFAPELQNQTADKYRYGDKDQAVVENKLKHYFAAPLPETPEDASPPMEARISVSAWRFLSR
jgi:Sec-independent protein translocase protein TatA